MDWTLLAALARSPIVVLAAVLAVLGLGLLLLVLWRRDALRDAMHAERHAWFVFATRVQALLLGAWLLLPPIAAAKHFGWLLAEWIPLPPLWAQVLDWVLPLACPFVLALASWFAVGDVERRVRGTHWPLRRRAAVAAQSLGVLALAVGGPLAASLVLRAGDLRLAMALALGGPLAAIALISTRRGIHGLVPEAATAGPLRDRVFELAARAGVTVRQVYVIQAQSIRQANAFAVTGGNVLLTDHLLGSLSRREVEAVIAHELAHLRHKHPTKLKCVLLGTSVLASPLVGVAGGFGFGLVCLLAYGAFLVAARRFEYEADREAVELAGDAAALVTALVSIGRLNHVPLHWSLAREWTLTHPSVQRRAEALVRQGLLPMADLDALLTNPPTDDPCWGTDPAMSPRVFGSDEKRATGQRMAWSVLLVSVLAPALVLMALHAAPLEIPRVVAFVVAGLASIAAALFAANFTACAGYAAWGRALGARRGAHAGSGLFAALAPSDGTLVYEGYADWDIGFLSMEPGALRYEGEQVSFAIERQRIESIEMVSGLPGWLPTPRVAVRWRDTDGVVCQVTARDARARALHEFPARARELSAKLRAWRAEPSPEGLRVLERGAPPDADRITGRAYAELVAPSTLLPAVVLMLAATLIAVVMTGLPIAPQSGAGAADVFAAAFTCLIVLRIPAWRARRPPRRADEGAIRQAA